MMDAYHNQQIPVTKDNIGQVVLSVFYNAYSAPNIIKAVKGVGFGYKSGPDVGQAPHTRHPQKSRPPTATRFRG